jgi:hypothetical protein
MKRPRNTSLWIGLLLTLAAPVTYFLVFVRFPLTRDVPWATFLIFLGGLALIARGWRKGVREPETYRGRIAGPIFMTAGAALFGVFVYAILYGARDLPPSHGAPRVGQKAPDFTLPDTDGRPVTLSGLLDAGRGGAAAAKSVLLIFYRGYW